MSSNEQHAKMDKSTQTDDEKDTGLAGLCARCENLVLEGNCALRKEPAPSSRPSSIGPPSAKRQRTTPARDVWALDGPIPVTGNVRPDTPPPFFEKAPKREPQALTLERLEALKDTVVKLPKPKNFVEKPPSALARALTNCHDLRQGDDNEQ
ncbi:hypothetical protein FA10DRAFT_257076 [Acaromyces ingoldii]|uniref:Uncharacterized protein n=1 Tax=Acaromyces ingoldii TaxID=215250 RepID=A0A316YU24_9BASI|nr:hypothetical protein FA10DRAFT_257076 [Acaromyces ingoldii]PWN92602.1 hypothetical protein FA10DRAFT_257076 [Acaromyces ingoldii]